MHTLSDVVYSIWDKYRISLTPDTGYRVWTGYVHASNGRMLPYGDPTDADIRLVKKAWYSQFHRPSNYITEGGGYEILDWSDSIRNYAIVRRVCDNTYWRIDELFSWTGKPYVTEVEPVMVKVKQYHVKNN